MTKITYKGREYDIRAAAILMDDELREEIHGAVETDQEFIDAYAAAHLAKYGQEFVIN